MTSLTMFGRDRRRLRIRRKPVDVIQPASPRPQRRDCQMQLFTALKAMGGSAMSIEDATMRPWCSATFLGTQHRIIVRIDGPKAMERAEVMTKGLRDAEFTLQGHIVADMTVDELRADDMAGAIATLGILTIEDW